MFRIIKETVNPKIKMTYHGERQGAEEPGIMPRFLNAIFDIVRENSTKFDFKVPENILPKQILLGR